MGSHRIVRFVEQGWPIGRVANFLRLDGANYFQEAHKNAGALIDMGAVAAWVALATAFCEMVV